jgi:hypothetical protein
MIPKVDGLTMIGFRVPKVGSVVSFFAWEATGGFVAEVDDGEGSLGRPCGLEPHCQPRELGR